MVKTTSVRSGRGSQRDTESATLYGFYQRIMLLRTFTQKEKLI